MFPLSLFATGPGEAPSTSPSILAMLETLQNASHLEVHKDMIRWILKVKYAAIISICLWGRENTAFKPSLIMSNNPCSFVADF